jgi:predicted RNA-binding Zn ribbon-like protein
MTNGTEYTFSRIGGRLCLDFTNTIGSHAGPNPNEHLGSYDDLVAWGRQLDVIPPRTAKQLAAEALDHPAMATACLAWAKELRGGLYRIFSAVATGGTPPAADLARLNRELKTALARQKLVLAGDKVTWTFESGPTDLDAMLWPVARSAADLLTGDEAIGRVRECASDTCGWLFVDTSKNGSRRWCDMADCGNRAKARRHYHRQAKP